MLRGSWKEKKERGSAMACPALIQLEFLKRSERGTLARVRWLFLLFGSDLHGDRLGLAIEGLACGPAHGIAVLDIRQRDRFAFTAEPGGLGDVNQLAIHGKRLG